MCRTYQAVESVGLPEYRRRGCKAETLNVILITRDRPLWNQAEVIRVMNRAGLEVDVTSIDETTPFQQQVDLFYSADIILSIHGSQLISSQFMQPGSTLIEFFPFLYFHNENNKLHEWTKIELVQMIDNLLPPKEVVRKINKSYIPKREKVEALSKQYTSTTRCVTNMDC